MLCTVISVYAVGLRLKKAVAKCLWLTAGYKDWLKWTAD